MSAEQFRPNASLTAAWVREILARVPPRLRAALVIATLAYFTGFLAAFTGGASASEMLTLSGWEDFFAGREYEAVVLDKWSLYGTSAVGLVVNWLVILELIAAIYFAIFNKKTISNVAKKFYSEAFKKFPLLIASWICFTIIWFRVIAFYIDPYGLITYPREVFIANWIILLVVIAGVCFAIINNKIPLVVFTIVCFAIIGFCNWFLFKTSAAILITNSLILLGVIAAICFSGIEIRNKLKQIRP